MNWIDATVAGILVTLIIYLIYRLFKVRVLFKTLSDLYMQEMADKMLLQKKIQELYQEIENAKLANSDGFLKFVSDSRDWAFQYIEETQSALEEFSKTVEPIFKWSDSFGTVLGDNSHSEKIKDISKAYDKLKSVLPKNNETPNN